jgi:hypothetical protein
VGGQSSELAYHSRSKRAAQYSGVQSPSATGILDGLLRRLAGCGAIIAAEHNCEGLRAWDSRSMPRQDRWARLARRVRRTRVHGLRSDVRGLWNFESRLSRLSRASRATAYSAGGLFQRPPSHSEGVSS